WEGPIALFVMLGITLIIFIARMWARLVVAKNAGLDDLLMGLAMIPTIGLTICAFLAIRFYGFQWHAWDQTNATHITSRELAMAVELHYLASTTLIKVSILFFYRRMTGALRNVFLYTVWFSIASCLIYWIIFSFLIIFTCTPVEGFFHLFDIVWRLKNNVTCRDEGAVIVACAIIGTVQDLVICLLPIILIWKLKMPRRQRLALCCIFAIGLITCVCGILRAYYATYVYYFTYDITWYAYYGWIWTALEADFGVICASAPALKVFFLRYFTLSNIGSYNSSVTPLQRPRSASKHVFPRSGHSASVSRVDRSGVRDEIPLAGIKVSQGLDIQINDRDDLSQKSFASTKNLTALPVLNAT
ncbi:hypothetical protein GQ44DRAFT_573203, partial [Phaeosphaeriaceae sp. PMI808]